MRAKPASALSKIDPSASAAVAVPELLPPAPHKKTPSGKKVSGRSQASAKTISRKKKTVQQQRRVPEQTTVDERTADPVTAGAKRIKKPATKNRRPQLVRPEVAVEVAPDTQVDVALEATFAPVLLMPEQAPDVPAALAMTTTNVDCTQPESLLALPENPVPPAVAVETAMESIAGSQQETTTFLQALATQWTTLLRALTRTWMWVQNKLKSHQVKKRLRVCETISLGEKRFVAVIQVDGEQFLVGGSSTSVSTLAHLESRRDFSDVFRSRYEQGLDRA